MTESTHRGGVVGATLIVCGCSIGGGMLALPTATAQAGFYPSLIVNFSCWFYTLMTGLFLMDVCLWTSPKEIHMASLSEFFFGKWGKVFICGLFIFLYESLLVSYFSGVIPCLNMVGTASGLLTESINNPGIYVVFGLLILSILVLGTVWIDRVNMFMMIGLVICFSSFMLVGSGKVDHNLLNHTNWSHMMYPLPVLLGAYGYHNVVPSLVSYLDRDRNKIKYALLFGTILPLIIYSLWQWLCLGTISSSMLVSLQKVEGIPIVEALFKITDSSSIKILAFSLSFFAIITSLLGVSFSMIDFLADILKVSSQGKVRIYLGIGTVFPPLLLSFFFPNLFITVFGIAAGFGETFLNGLFPIFIMWIACYILKFKQAKKPFGGKKTLLILTFYSFIVIIVEIFNLVTTHKTP